RTVRILPPPTIISQATPLSLCKRWHSVTAHNGSDDEVGRPNHNPSVPTVGSPVHQRGPAHGCAVDGAGGNVMDNQRLSTAAGAGPAAVSRRALLGGGAGLVGAALLAGCSSGGGAGGSGADGPYPPPSYPPLAGVEPDLPGTEDGVSPAFLSFRDPPVDRDGFPLPQTETVTALLQGVPPSLAPDRNEA